MSTTSSTPCTCRYLPLIPVCRQRQCICLSKILDFDDSSDPDSRILIQYLQRKSQQKAKLKFYNSLTPTISPQYPQNIDQLARRKLVKKIELGKVLTVEEKSYLRKLFETHGNKDGKQRKEDEREKDMALEFDRFERLADRLAEKEKFSGERMIAKKYKQKDGMLVITEEKEDNNGGLSTSMKIIKMEKDLKESMETEEERRLEELIEGQREEEEEQEEAEQVEDEEEREREGERIKEVEKGIVKAKKAEKKIEDIMMGLFKSFDLDLD